MIRYSLERIIWTKRFWGVLFVLTVITSVDAIQHVVMASGQSFTKIAWLSTFMASSLVAAYIGHLLIAFTIGLFPVWILLGSGFALLNDFESGQAYNVASRVGVAKFLRGHYIGAGISSVILFAVPLLWNALLIYILRLFPFTRWDGQAQMLQSAPKIPKYDFLLWQFRHPAATFWLYLALFLLAAFLVGMLMISFSLILNRFYQVLTVTVLATVLLGSQIFNIGTLVQTFAPLVLVRDWANAWIDLLAILAIFSLAIYFWRKRGELE